MGIRIKRRCGLIIADVRILTDAEHGKVEPAEALYKPVILLGRSSVREKAVLFTYIRRAQLLSQEIFAVMPFRKLRHR